MASVGCHSSRAVGLVTMPGATATAGEAMRHPVHTLDRLERDIDGGDSACCVIIETDAHRFGAIAAAIIGALFDVIAHTALERCQPLDAHMIRAIATALDGASCDIAMNNVLAAQQRSSSLAAVGACSIRAIRWPGSPR